MADLTGSFGQATSSRETAPLTEVFILDLSAYAHPANQRTWSLQNRMYRLWRKRGKRPWALTTPKVFPLARETLLSGGSLELMPPNSSGQLSASTLHNQDCRPPKFHSMVTSVW